MDFYKFQVSKQYVSVPEKKEPEADMMVLDMAVGDTLQCRSGSVTQVTNSSNNSGISQTSESENPWPGTVAGRQGDNVF